MTECFRGCGTEIMFDDEVVSSSGKKIPLELDGNPHQCPLSDYKGKSSWNSGSSSSSNSGQKSSSYDTKLKKLQETVDQISHTQLRVLFILQSILARIDNKAPPEMSEVEKQRSLEDLFWKEDTDMDTNPEPESENEEVDN